MHTHTEYQTSGPTITVYVVVALWLPQKEINFDKKG